MDTASIGLHLSRARSYLHAAFKANWQQLQHERFTLCKGAYLFVINVTLLVVALITLLTSNQPTDVDKKALEAVTQSLEMHKALLQQSVQDAKTANETLKSTMESLDAEKESLKLQRQSLEKEQSAFDLQKQSLELAKWTAYHVSHIGAIYTVQKTSSTKSRKPRAEVGYLPIWTACFELCLITK